MSVFKDTLAITTLQQLYELDGFLLVACYRCEKSEFISAIALQEGHKEDTPLRKMSAPCPHCHEVMRVIPMITPYDWVVAKLMQRELSLC